jgi:hypothetical protein
VLGEAGGGVDIGGGRSRGADVEAGPVPDGCAVGGAVPTFAERLAGPQGDVGGGEAVGVVQGGEEDGLLGG